MEVSPEIREAQVILEKGVRFSVPAPFFLSLFGKKTISFTLYDPTASVCLDLTAMRLGMQMSDEEFEEMTVEQGLAFMEKNGKTIARMLALAILRSKFRNQLLGNWLAKRLLKNYPFSTLSDMMNIITLGGGLQDFINIMGLLKTVRLTKPNHPSQKTQRS